MIDAPPPRPLPKLLLMASSSWTVPSGYRCSGHWLCLRPRHQTTPFAIGSGNHTSSTGGPASRVGTSPAVSTQTSVAAQAPAPVAATVLLDKTGSGINKTPSFTAAVYVHRQRGADAEHHRGHDTRSFRVRGPTNASRMRSGPPGEHRAQYQRGQSRPRVHLPWNCAPCRSCQTQSTCLAPFACC